jgi:hypothetical protein
MQEPNLIINWPAIIVSTFAAFVFGGLWYGPLFGKIWAGQMGMKMDQKPERRTMMRAFALQAIGLFLTSYVLAHVGQVWRPSVWGVGQDEGPAFMWGFTCAFFTWIGFYVPMQFGKISWEGKSWKLFFINSAHDFFTLLIISVILAYWR